MTLLRIAGLTKSYAGVSALSDVSLDIATGEVHALCGENGAGKSTLIKCLAGVTSPDSGTVELDNTQLHFGNVADSESLGIAVIHQESTTFPDLNAVDNIFVGRELKNSIGFLNHAEMQTEAMRLMQLLGQHFDVTRPLSELSLACRQMVAMARSLSQNCKLLIMDEPTASLSARETETLMQTVKRLKSQGVTIVYVSHRLGEVFELADRVTVLRDGSKVTTSSIDDLNEEQLIKSMVGRETHATRQRQNRTPGDVRLEVRNLTNESFANVTFSIHSGEILGIAGLVGAGRSELARAIIGLDSYSGGEVLIENVLLPKHDVKTALVRGLALVPEDRQHEGLVLPMAVLENMSLAVVNRLRKHFRIDRSQERSLVEELMQRLQVKAASANAPTESLSGGNQQKVVLGKWLATEPRVLILDEPTRGVDVGAKAQVHQLVHDLASDGMATLMISSELPELLEVCDRILIMRDGRITGEVEASTATEEQILELALHDVVQG